MDRVVYLAIDLDKTVGDLWMRAGLALTVIEVVPMAYLGRYGDRRLDRGGCLCAVIGRPEIRLALSEDMVSDECPDDAMAEGMRRPGHVYEWEAKQ